MYYSKLLTHTKIVGVMFNQRIQYVKKLHEGEELLLRRDYSNLYDSNAVEVLDSRYNLLGYIPKETAAVVATAIDMGLCLVCFVSNLNYHDNSVCGANLIIAYK